MQYEQLNNVYEETLIEMRAIKDESDDKDIFIEELQNGIENKTNLIKIQETEILKLEKKIKSLGETTGLVSVPQSLEKNLVEEKTRVKKLKGKPH